MVKRSRGERMKENAASASVLALQLAQDRKFRERLLSTIEHGVEAGRRIGRGVGVRGAVARLATDQTLLRELRSAHSDLQQAYERLEAKRRSHKLRNFIVLAALALLAGVPQRRERVAGIAKASKLRQRLAELANRTAQSTASDDSPPRPRRLEDLTKEDLEDLTKEELYARALEVDIPGRSEMSKEQLIQALRART
jgi:hypothetical protein